MNDVSPQLPTSGERAAGDAGRAAPYVPRMLLQYLASDPTTSWWTSEGSAAFVDVSGFTRLSEALARKGREGAEHIADAIGGICESMLAVAYANGGSLLKFGGDALLLWFDGDRHEGRACRAAIEMRARLAEVGLTRVDAGLLRPRPQVGADRRPVPGELLGEPLGHTLLGLRLLTIPHPREPAGPVPVALLHAPSLGDLTTEVPAGSFR